MKFCLEIGFEYAQTELRMQLHLKVKLLNDRSLKPFFVLLMQYYCVCTYIYFPLNLRIPDSSEIVLTAVLWSSIVN